MRLTFLFVTFALAACAPAAAARLSLVPGNCALPVDGIIPLPTTTAFPNPMLATAVPAATDTPTAAASVTPLPWCTPTPSPSPQAPHPTAWPTATSSLAGGAAEAAVTNGTGVDSLTIDIGDQTVLAAAAGPAGHTLFWQENGTIVAATTAPGGTTQLITRPVAPGEAAAAVYAPAGRLHLVYAREGALFYRAAEAGTHISDAADERLGAGAQPALAVDAAGWPHLLYTSEGSIFHRARSQRGWEAARPLGAGETVAAVATDAGALLAATRAGSTIRVYQHQDGQWREQAAIAAAGAIGTPRLDAAGAWVYLAWITEAPDPEPDNWPRRRPEYKPAMPFAGRVHSGDNAQQYFTTFGVHDAGLYQTFATAPGTPLLASAQYMGWSCDEPSPCPAAAPGAPNPPSGSGANMRAQLCIDPSGGVDIYSPAVLCSGASNSLDTWATLSLATVAQAGSATLFLRTRPDLPRKHNDVYWDGVQLDGGTLVNPGLDGAAFPAWNGTAELKVAAGWTPFYVEDRPRGAGTGRYTLQATWSGDAGLSWSQAIAVASNSTPSHDKSGAFAPDAYPVINPAHRTVAFLFMRLEGDPVAGEENRKRFGRPALAVCPLGETACGGDVRLLFPGEVNRPAVTLVASVSHRRQVVVAWDAYQSSSATNKDIFSAILSP